MSTARIRCAWPSCWTWPVGSRCAPVACAPTITTIATRFPLPYACRSAITTLKRRWISVSKPFEPSSIATSSPGNGAVRDEPAPAPRTTFGEPDPTAHVTVMFSGGSDSTLTASMFAEKYAHVHLLTYKHAAMSFEEKCVKSLERLQKAHGADRFTHKFIDINPLMARMFVKPLARDLREYGTYALPMCCGACKLSMHVQTILYNRARKIEYAADGSNVELSELFPEQMPEVLELYRQLYERYGIRYSNPVLDRKSTRLN